ncbi:MAG: D-alanyl-lipoteichoic acid biosynthesis protein DltB [Enterococcus sp.]
MNTMHMIPYASPIYFVWLGIALLPLVFALLKGHRLAWYQAGVTLFFLAISFGGQYKEQGVALIGYVLFQTALVRIYFATRQKVNRTWIFYLVTLLAILPLALTKLVPVITQNHKEPLLYFLGISYLTFKSVQMIMEIRDGSIKEYTSMRYIQFLLFFPTISSGPIDRYRRFEKDVIEPIDPNAYVDLLNKGIQKIFLGFLYKYIIGYYLGSVLLPYVSQLSLAHGGISLPLIGYMYTYSLYLFFDFAGYSLFAVGTSYIMGYNTPINFNRPFLSWNIKEFWNRWHMSLSFWFRDYVYMRLMFFLIKNKVFKSRIVASNVGYFVLFLLMGIWHGLTWYYIVYGIYHALLICLTDSWLRFKKKHKQKIPSNQFTHGLAIFLTFQAVCFSLLIFSGFLDKLFFI